MVAGGHWIPELKILAGGRDDLFSPGCAAQRLEWATVRDYDLSGLTSVILLSRNKCAEVSGSIPMRQVLSDVSVPFSPCAP
ncbi:hypothetical protein C2W62_54090, partial [Candidatus Entotheonella serta]